MKIFTQILSILCLTLQVSFAQTTVFQNGEEGFLCYRIPAIVKAPNGDLLAFCEARRLNCSDHGDVRIVLKRSTDNGSTWSKLEIVAENGNDQAGNPAPVFDLMDSQYKNGRLFLFYNTGTASEQEVRQGKAIREVWYKTSADNGKTWSKPVNITPSVSRPNKPSVNVRYNFKEDWRSYANTPGHAIQLTKGELKGRLFIAANHSAGVPQDNARDYIAHGFYSDNHGKTWQITPNINYPSSNESTAAELSTGGILVNARNQSGDSKHRILAFSKNGGAKWDTVYIEKQLADPVCEGSMINFTTKEGKNALIFSNLDHATQRENLTIKVSTDDGKTWNAGKVICPTSTAYSDLVIQSDDKIGVLYERDNYSKIVYERFTYEDLIAPRNINLSWWKPSDSPFPTVDGQAWSSEMKDSLYRLPPRAEALVRKPVWGLSKNSAGLYIRFISNTPQIVVRYKASGNVSMPHMPSTGVSGVDLYAIDSDGEWHFCAGKYSFKDTITYTFEKLRPNDKYHKLGREYRLYLPLYNTIRDLEIGVPEGNNFTPLAKMGEKPIVVYGTSIAQGACASRPGMAWTNILARKFDRPIINLAFSGNGQLERELIDFINEIDAKVYVLDCLPNMVSTRFERKELQKRIIESVKSIRLKHPNTPILLTEHAGYTEGYAVPERQKLFEEANQDLQEAFARLQQEGILNIFTLKIGEIGLDLDAMVDGTHPNDYGMMRYAEAYEKKLRLIMNEPKGMTSTQIPTRQNREPGSYNWEARHYEMMALNKTEPTKVLMIGNSITHNWGGKPLNNRIRGASSWDKYLAPLQARNFGFGWDRVENVLWRVYHEELDGISPDKIVINIGTNNLLINTDEEIISGLRMLIEAIKTRQPQSKIYLLGLYPRRGQESRIVKLNKGIQDLAQSSIINFADIGTNLLLNTGKINEKLFSDGLHPNTEGYELLGKALSEILK